MQVLRGTPTFSWRCKALGTYHKLRELMALPKHRRPTYFFMSDVSDVFLGRLPVDDDIVAHLSEVYGAVGTDWDLLLGSTGADWLVCPWIVSRLQLVAQLQLWDVAVQLQYVASCKSQTHVARLRS